MQDQTKKASSQAKTRVKGGTAARSTKTERILILLRRPTGATVAELSKVAGWQEHSVRGFISGNLKRRKGLDILSEKDVKGVRRYRIGNEAA